MAIRKVLNPNGELVPMNLERKTPVVKEVKPIETLPVKPQPVINPVKEKRMVTMKELKSLCDVKGIKYRGNVSRKVLTEMLDAHQDL